MYITTETGYRISIDDAFPVDVTTILCKLIEMHAENIKVSIDAPEPNDAPKED